MKINSHTLISGEKVVLVPYRREHVLKYHAWMQSVELQELTASEPLTLEEEYKMQQSWWQDQDKCTFVILDAEIYSSTGQDEIAAMIGDVNLFLNDPDDKSSGELEIMIAEPSCRGKGCGKEALLAMMKYASTKLAVTTFTAKIGYSNEKSLKMFEKFNFSEISRSDVFQEVTLSLTVTDSVQEWIDTSTKHLIIKIEPHEEAR